MFHEHDKTLIAMVAVLLVVAAFYVFAAGPSKPVHVPKLSQASLDLDTDGCPTTFMTMYCQNETEWALTKTTGSSGEGAYLFNVTVVEGKTSTKLRGTGQIVLTNSGEQNGTLSSVIVNLEKSAPGTGDDFGPSGENWDVLASAVESGASACDGTGVSCYGNMTQTEGSVLVLYNSDGNPITLAEVGPIPATKDNDGDGLRDEDCPDLLVDNDQDGAVDEDPINGVDDDLDGRVDEDDVAMDNDNNNGTDEDCYCEDAVKIDFSYEFDITGMDLEGAKKRIDLVATFVGSGQRSKSDASCTADVDCDGGYDTDDPSTPSNESETDNVRSVQQRYEFYDFSCKPALCQQVTLADSGASADTGCVDLTSEQLNEVITASGADGTKYEYTIEGQATCKGDACQTDVTNIATLTCEGGSSLISGSPASASFNVACEEEGCITPPSGMISWYDGDNATVPEDIWGNYDGTFVNGATTSPAGMVGSAFSFDGINDSISIPDPTGGKNEFTFDAWVFFDSVDRDQFIAGDWGNGWVLFQRGGDLDFYVRDAGSNMNIMDKGIVTAGNWHHIAAVYNGSGQSYLYVDGVAVGSNQSHGLVDAGNPTAYIGYSGYAGHAYFDGMIDEVEIYGRALSAAEIEEIYDSQSAGKCKPEEPPPEECADVPSGVFAWYPGDNNVDDIIGGYDGSLSGGASYIDPGYVQQAFSCDGTTGSYIDISPLLHAPDLNSNDGSVDMWVYLKGTSASKRAILTIGDHDGTELFQVVDDFGKLLVSISKSNTTPTDSGAMWTAVSDAEVLKPYNGWYHIAVSFNASNPSMPLGMYVNGASVPFTYSTPTDKSGWWDDVVASADNVKVCIRDDGYWTPQVPGHGPLSMNGYVDEIEFFNRPLTADEVYSLYAAGHAGKCPVECKDFVLLATKNNFNDPPGKTWLMAELYSIDPLTSTVTQIKSENITVSTSVYNFNGNAFDSVNKRFYFAESLYADQPFPLHFYDVGTTPVPNHIYAGKLNGSGTDGTFYNGNYYYVKERTDDLRKVSFYSNGSVFKDEFVADLLAGTNYPTSILAFGDISASPQGKVYISATRCPTTACGTSTKLFGHFNLDGSGYTEIPSGADYGAGAIQIAFGEDGVLYGMNAGSGQLLSIDTTNGQTTNITVLNMKPSDLASGPCVAYGPVQE